MWDFPTRPWPRKLSVEMPMRFTTLISIVRDMRTFREEGVGSPLQFCSISLRDGKATEPKHARNHQTVKLA